MTAQWREKGIPVISTAKGNIKCQQAVLQQHCCNTAITFSTDGKRREYTLSCTTATHFLSFKLLQHDITDMVPLRRISSNLLTRTLGADKSMVGKCFIPGSSSHNSLWLIVKKFQRAVLFFTATNTLTSLKGSRNNLRLLLGSVSSRLDAVVMAFSVPVMM